MRNHTLVLACALGLLSACQSDDKATEANQKPSSTEQKTTASAPKAVTSEVDKPQPATGDVTILDKYATFELTSDLSHLSDNQKAMIAVLIKAARIMDDLFWRQAFGEDKNRYLKSLGDESLRKAVEINYGPWDRLNGDAAFINGHRAKSLGAEFYPQDIQKSEIENTENADIKSLYTLVERDSQGQLIAVPYHEKYKDSLQQASDLLKQAAELAEDPGFKKYLSLRAEALITDDFKPSDLAWMDMKNNAIDVVIGPIETYEDQLFGYKAAYEAYVLIKDLAWSEKLAKFAAFLPQLQKELPVADAYKTETPGTDSDLNAYDAVYYAGHSNAGSKTIAINLPNDESVQLEKGTRRLQLKNVMQAKFEKILVPIADQVVAPEQRKHITFNAFFANTMFHEVAHGLGIKNTINDKGTVRTALKEHASPIEEGKADILGLYMVEKLHHMGELEEGELMDYYTTFMAGIFRSVRFGSSSAHGVANVLRFNYFADQGAFDYNETTGHYAVNPEKMTAAIASLSEKILKHQGDGDYQAISQWMNEKGQITPQLKKALDTINGAGIPVDVDFKQGPHKLDL